MHVTIARSQSSNKVIVSTMGIFLLLNLLFAHNSWSWFSTGQNAYRVVSALGFNNAGYLDTPGDGLLFNHPGNLATDGNRLLLADTRNNRVLIWNNLPRGNISPNIALGQDNLITNDPGESLNRLNWPVGISTAQGKVVVADTNNDRILIWNSFPVESGQIADLSIDIPKLSGQLGGWPWAVWTDGTKLVATLTWGGKVLVWNTFPTANDQYPDFILRAQNSTDGTNRFGTPRSIGTDGTSYLMIGDHNPNEIVVTGGNFFWIPFPTLENQPYNFFMANSADTHLGLMWGGEIFSDGKLISITYPGISIWNSLPTMPSPPDLFVGRGGPSESCDANGYNFSSGDGSGVSITLDQELYISLSNGNKVVGYNSRPVVSNQCPDFVIGAPDLNTNTLKTNYIIGNPVPATDGKGLFVTSDFDRKLYIWKSLPTSDGTYPDIVHDLQFPPWDNALYGNTFVIAGRQNIQVWTTLPTSGNCPPDITFEGKIGSVTFQNITGVALDDKYLYVADFDARKIYGWKNLPEVNSSPVFTIDLQSYPARLSSDGVYLSVAMIGEGKVKIYEVNSMSSMSVPVGEVYQIGLLRLLSGPSDALVAENHLFIADTNNSRVLCWQSIQDAIDGRMPDAILGKQNLDDTTSAIGVNSLFWPGGLAFYGNKLWVGEFKFSRRLIGFYFFSDVPSGYWAEGYISAIFNAHITTGCSQNPLNYCPEDNVTRGQMAAFIIRALYGESFAYTQTPYFTDVPSTHDFFKYVQKMKDTGITVVTGTYDVDGTVTRGQMAAFIIRALYGESFAYTQTPYFTDVPSTHGFFKYVQKMKDDGITAVTGTYDVEGTVTRAQMAAFLSRAFLGME